jgi:tripartite-type tricarboxylate transporter receptor subunit TctC
MTRTWTAATAHLLPPLSLFVCFAVGIALVEAASAQSTYPDRPLRLVVAAGPGGVADTIARMVGQKLSDRFGQPVVADNRAGAGGLVGAKTVAAAAPNGYTLLVITAAIVSSAATSKEAVDPRTQLTPIAFGAGAALVMAAHGSTPAKNLMDFVRNVKGGRFTYSTAGHGTSAHFVAAYVFKAAGGLDATHVPFPGGLAPLTAVVAKEVDLTVPTLPTALPFIKDGRLRPLAVATHKRIDTLPNVPTLAEAGFVDFEHISWIGFFAPPGMPPAIVRRLDTEINDALRQPDVRERLVNFGFEPRTSSQREFARYVSSEMTKWEEIVKKTRIALH